MTKKPAAKPKAMSATAQILARTPRLTPQLMAALKDHRTIHEHDVVVLELLNLHKLYLDRISKQLTTGDVGEAQGQIQELRKYNKFFRDVFNRRVKEFGYYHKLADKQEARKQSRKAKRKPATATKRRAN